MSRTAAIAFFAMLLATGAALCGAFADQPKTFESARDATLPIGQQCIVYVDQLAGPVEVSGRLTQASERWLVLHCDTIATSEHGVPQLNKVPYVNRLFKNTGIARSVQDRWIPRERVLYVEVPDALEDLSARDEVIH